MTPFERAVPAPSKLACHSLDQLYLPLGKWIANCPESEDRRKCRTLHAPLLWHRVALMTLESPQGRGRELL